MKHYVIRRAAGGPEWDAIPALQIDEALWGPSGDVSAAAQIAWDDARLWVRLTAREKHIRAEHTGPLGMPCEDSCLEFFLRPLPEDLRYFNIEYNPNASLYLGYGDGATAVRLLPEAEWFHPEVERTAGGWSVQYAVPFAFVRLFAPGFSPAPGATLMANCYKCGDLTPVPHYLAWNPCGGDTPNFHQPRDFGMMTFE